MEIESVESYALQVPLDRKVGDSRLTITDVYWIVVEVATDEGYTGTGWMGSLGFAPKAMKDLLDAQFAGEIEGMDPFETEAIRSKLRRETIYYGENGLSAWPRSAIDVALWDIKSQAAGEPLYRFLGGSDPEVPAYVSSMDTHYELDELADLHGSYAAEGFTAFKTKVGNRPVDEERARVREIRDAVGDDADLFVDANQAWTVSEAVDVVSAIDEYDVGWVEEPISQYNLEGHRRLVEAVDPPLATGEMLYRPEQFNHLIDRNGVEIVQPDLIRSGGITGQRTVARIAETHDIPFASHFYYAVSAHVVSAADNGVVAEYIPEYDIAPLLEEGPDVSDGSVVLPERPGHGYRISDAARDQFEVSL